MFMRRPHSVIELQIETPTLASPGNTEEFVEEVSERMRRAHAFVRENLKCGFDRAKRRYDSRIKSMQYKVGDFVWYYMPKHGADLNRKWMLTSQGPYCVTRSINDVNKVIQRTLTSKPIIVHIDRLTHYHGEIPACWLNANAAAPCGDTAAGQSESGECITGTQACNQENKTNPVSAQPESGQMTSSRQRRAPAYLAEYYLTKMASSVTRVCSRCEVSFQSVAGWKKHMLAAHQEVWTADGRMTPADDDEVESRLAALRRSQQNSHRRRADKKKADAAASSSPPASRLCLLSSPTEEQGAAAAVEMLMAGDWLDILPTSVDVAVQATVDTCTVAAGSERPRPRHRRVSVQATATRQDIGVGDATAEVRSRGIQQHWTGDVARLPAGLSVADVVQAVTEAAGQSPAVVASRMLVGRDLVPPEQIRMLQSFCLVAAAAQRAAGLEVLRQASSTPADEAARRRLAAWASDVVNWDLPEVQLRRCD